ncbi:MAG: prolyl oligopeptidase family serine peptidase [Brachybacterium sp.]|nr:prolyl oligopeptidase family serine peptidase [Brachybacterium sp.]
MSTDARFLDLQQFIATTRHSGLALSPDGERLITTITELDEDGSAYISALWELPTGAAGSVERPRRLTRGAEGESLLGFTPYGDILFTAKRPDVEHDTAVRLLPRAGGESIVVLRRPGAIRSVQAARDGNALVFVGDVYPSALDGSFTPEKDDADADAPIHPDTAIAAARREAKTSAVLHDSFPVRHWDSDLGPARPQVFVVERPEGGWAVAHDEYGAWAPRRLTSQRSTEQLRDISLTPDGGTVYASVNRVLAGTTTRADLIAVDVADGAIREIAQREGHSLSAPVISADGARLLVTSATNATDEVPLAVTLHHLDAATGELTPAITDESWAGDWPSDLALTADGSAAVFTTAWQGHGAIHRLDLAAGTVQQLTDGRQHYASLALDERSDDVYVLADAIDAPPAPAVLRAALPGPVSAVPTPVEMIQVPGTLEEVTTTAADGTSLRAWLCLPHEVSAEDPAPFLLWIHGGPMGSWNAWTWRWNPWTATARGYAVLLPDPAISTGYGQHMIDRGWGQLGGTPFDDLMRLTDSALERYDLDEGRTAAMGGSYGGYMANWVAGHTGNRFDCIVTHASLYNLEQFRGTTDTAEYWSANLTDRHNAIHSPDAFVDRIEVPMLVIHGDKDYRVPIGEGLRLWYELLATQNAERGEHPHRFLYYPDEGHWIQQPGNSAVWYETVFAFLAEHVLGEEWVRPRLLG